MGTGTLILGSGLATPRFIDRTLDSTSKENERPEERIQKRMLEHKFGPKFHFRRHNLYYAHTDYLNSLNIDQSFGTYAPDMHIIKQETREETVSIWETSKFIDLLSQPLGSPIELTPEEANEIVRLAAGRRPDLPEGKDFTIEVREQLGHSLSDRLDKSES